MAKLPKAHIGTDAWGELDDLLLEEVSLVRLERVERDRWCLVCYREKRRILVHLQAHQSTPRQSRLSVRVIEDELGCDQQTGERMAELLFPPVATVMRARAVDGLPMNGARFVPGTWRKGVK